VNDEPDGTSTVINLLFGEGKISCLNKEDWR
jgi:hypothetical protein